MCVELMADPSEAALELDGTLQINAALVSFLKTGIGVKIIPTLSQRD